jgi:polar amino acid transport system substrate-binding protein
VVLDAIRNQLKSATENKSDDIVIEPVSIKSAQDGLNKIRSGEADIACGVAFTWERQRTLTYSLPFQQAACVS